MNGNITSLDEYFASDSAFLKPYRFHMEKCFSEQSILFCSKNIADTIIEAVSKSGLGNFCSNVTEYFKDSQYFEKNNLFEIDKVNKDLFRMEFKDRLFYLLRPFITVNNLMKSYNLKDNNLNLVIKEVLYYSSKESPYAFKIQIGNSFFQNNFFLKWYNPLRILALIIMDQLGIGYKFNYHPKGQEYIIPELKSKSKILEKRNHEIREKQKQAKDIKRRAYTVIENYVEDAFYATQSNLYDRDDILSQIGVVAHFCIAFMIEDVIANPQNIIYNYDGGLLTAYMIDSADMFSSNSKFLIKEEIAKLLKVCGFYSDDNVNLAVKRGEKLIKGLVKRNRQNLFSFINDLKLQNVHYRRESKYGNEYISIADKINNFVDNFG